MPVETLATNKGPQDRNWPQLTETRSIEGSKVVCAIRSSINQGRANRLRRHTGNNTTTTRKRTQEGGREELNFCIFQTFLSAHSLLSKNLTVITHN